MLKVAPVSTKYLSLVNLSVKKIRPAFAGKCIAVAVASVGKAAPFVASLPAAASEAPASLCRGGCDHRVWPPQESHRASAAFIMAAAVPWAPAPTVSLIYGRRRIKNIARKRSLSGDTPAGRCCLSFPMRTLGLRPCIPREGEAIQSKIATCSFQTVQAKYFSKNQTARLSCCRHQGYLKCLKGLAWGGWRGHWHI